VSKPSWVADHFTAASWSGGTWGTGNFIRGELHPASVVRNLIWTYLSSDARLQDIFPGSRIEQMDLRDPRIVDSRKLPRLQIYTGSLREDSVATRLDLQDIRVFIGIRFALDTAFKALEPGEPDVMEVMGHIRSVLKAKKSLPVRFGDTDVPAARQSQQDGELQMLVDFDQSGQPAALTLELAWLFSLATDFDSQVPVNLE
jgi:hypothetical protein